MTLHRMVQISLLGAFVLGMLLGWQLSRPELADNLKTWFSASEYNELVTVESSSGPTSRSWQPEKLLLPTTSWSDGRRSALTMAGLMALATCLMFFSLLRWQHNTLQASLGPIRRLVKNLNAGLYHPPDSASPSTSDFRELAVQIEKAMLRMARDKMAILTAPKKVFQPPPLPTAQVPATTENEEIRALKCKIDLLQKTVIQKSASRNKWIAQCQELKRSLAGQTKLLRSYQQRLVTQSARLRHITRDAQNLVKEKKATHAELKRMQQNLRKSSHDLHNESQLVSQLKSHERFSQLRCQRLTRENQQLLRDQDSLKQTWLANQNTIQELKQEIEQTRQQLLQHQARLRLLDQKATSDSASVAPQSQSAPCSVNSDTP